MIDGRCAKILDPGKNQTAPVTADLMAEEHRFANKSLDLNQTNIIEHGIRAYKGIMKTGALGYMKTRQLGNSDLFITPVGYGSWAIGGSGWQFAWGKQNDNDSVAAIHRALELGVNWIDTAAVYGLGHSEEVVTRALSSWPGPRPYLFTKCGLRWDAQGQTHRVLTATSIRQECEDSLRRLNVDAIDLYQIHWPVEDMKELEEGWSTMAQLQHEGKARWIGVSNFNVEQMKRAEVIAPITTLQPPYSLVHLEVESEILPFCEDKGIGVIVYSPMASGLLTGAMTRERISKLSNDDWRKHDPDFNEPSLSANLALVERLRAVGKRRGYAPGAVAVAWTLRHAAVTGAIVGARKPEQVDDVVAAAGVYLTQCDLAEIETVAELAGRGQ
jgi:aryl-alcohol dehydrogenase-like predicted oxidoreductase